MNATGRAIVAVALILFAWKDAALRMPWPPQVEPKVPLAVASEEATQAAKPVRALAAKMLPTDREYLSKFYDCMRHVLARDARRTDPVVSTTDKLIAFHTSSLQLAIDQSAVGKTPGLGEAVDLVFMETIGADPRLLTGDDREKLADACAALASAFKVGENE